MGTVKSNFNSTQCQDPGLRFRRQRLTDEWEQIITGKKRSPLPRCIYSKSFASLFTFLGIILILFPHQLPSFHLAPSPFHPPRRLFLVLPLLLHLCCIRAPVVSARHKWMRAPGGPRLLCHTSLTLALSQSHKRDLPAFVPCRHCLPVVMVTSRRRRLFFFFFPFAADAWLCRARVGWMEPWVGAATLHLMPGQAATWTLTPHFPLIHHIFHFLSFFFCFQTPFFPQLALCIFITQTICW